MNKRYRTEAQSAEARRKFARLQGPQLRLLKLYPGVDDEQIECSLELASFDDKPKYEALSYVWGDPDVTAQITVDGEARNITTNLRDFLRIMRHPTRCNVLWADAICIDQLDPEEKEHQVRLMSRIYSTAIAVHVWLGYFPDTWADELPLDSSDAFKPTMKMNPAEWRDFRDRFAHIGQRWLRFSPNNNDTDLRRVSSQNLLEYSIQTLNSLSKEDDKHLPEIPMFSRSSMEFGSRVALSRNSCLIRDLFIWILSRPWWQRVWTFQEVILSSSDPILHIGNKWMPLSTILTLRERLYSHFNCCCVLYVRAFLGPFTFIKLSLHLKRAEQILNIRRIRSNDTGWSKSVSLMKNYMHAFGAARLRQSSDLRDRYLGTLGLMDEAFCEALPATLSDLEPSDVFSIWSRLLYNNVTGGYFLSDAVGLEKLSESRTSSPTWVLDPVVAGRQRFPGMGFKFNRDFFTYSYTHPVYNTESLGDKVVQMKGMKICVVQKCERPTAIFCPDDDSSDASVLRRRLQFYHEFMSDAGYESGTDAFWGAVFLDFILDITKQSLKNEYLPRFLKQVKLWWQNQLDPDNFDGLFILDSFAHALSGALSTGLVPDLSTILSYTESLATNFFCSSGGEPGRSPCELKAQDEIFYVHGCRVPVCLRRLHDKDPAKRGTDDFQYVGPCYLAGHMYGTAELLVKEQWKPIWLH